MFIRSWIATVALAWTAIVESAQAPMRETVLRIFDNSGSGLADVAFPYGGVIMDATGALYGTT